MAEKNPLSDEIDAEIRLTGPMSVAHYMQLCLTHPKYGYYMHVNPLGRGGDFVTAPEISQLFGEMIGIWSGLQWETLGRPAEFELLELGPGRGTMMTDMLRVIAMEPKILAACRLVLLEANKALVTEQKKRLSNANPRWISELTELDPDGPPLFAVANEFFDALPIRQYQKAKGSWHERLIGIDDAGKRIWGLSPTPMPDASLPEAIRSAGDGEIWEAGFAAGDTMRMLAALIARRGGALLVIDYGYERTQTGDTFQAVAAHRYADPLADPGMADLTAHVDFEALGAAARDAGLEAGYFGTQNEFLRAMGIAERAEGLIARNPDKKEMIAAGLDRLTAPGQMGELFKVLTGFPTRPAVRN